MNMDVRLVDNQTKQNIIKEVRSGKNKCERKIFFVLKLIVNLFLIVTLSIQTIWILHFPKCKSGLFQRNSIPDCTVSSVLTASSGLFRSDGLICLNF